MLDALKRLLASAAPVTPSPSPRAPEVQVAAAALLLELAHADGEFSAEEQAHVRSALARHFALDDAAVTALLAYAEEARAGSIDHFGFTRSVAAQYDLGQKMVLAEVMWGVILADGVVGEHEAYLIRKISNLLGLAPGFLSEARARTLGHQND